MKKPEVNTGVVNASGKNPKKITEAEAQAQIRRMRDRDAELVTGIFKNLENPASGGSRGAVCFSYKAYPGDANEQYELLDGQRYQLPRGVARHLNNNCWYNEYQQMSGELGMQGVRQGAADGRLKAAGMQLARKIHRYAFHSLEYMDDDLDMYPANLTEVTVKPLVG